MSKVSPARRRELLAMNLPTEAEMIRRVRGFLLRSGLTLGEMAEMAGYSPSSLRVFISGRYDAERDNDNSSLSVRATLKSIIDQHELNEDIDLLGTHHSTRDFKAVHRSALNALEKGSAYLVDGPPGTQKTWTLRTVQQEINQSGKGHAVYIYARDRQAPQSFLIECCTSAGIPTRGSIDQLIRKLRFFLGSHRTLLMVDEAQHLDHHGLEVLRQLLDLPPHFGVMLAGSHDLSQRLSHWQMDQWRSRLRKTHYMNGLTDQEAEDILIAELGKMPKDIIGSVIDSARSEASRNGSKFRYIHARLLFWAIEDTKQRLAERRGATTGGTESGVRMRSNEAVNRPYGKVTVYFAGDEMQISVRLLTLCRVADRLLKGWVVATALYFAFEVGRAWINGAIERAVP